MVKGHHINHPTDRNGSCVALTTRNQFENETGFGDSLIPRPQRNWPWNKTGVGRYSRGEMGGGE